MDVSFIIVNYNTLELTSRCIQSILDKVHGISYEIIVVDNASPDMDPDEFKSRFPSIILIKSESNLGFAKGNNRGIQASKAKYILLLNSDCELINNAPKVCYDYMEHTPGCGMSTVQLLYPNGAIQNNCRRFRTIGWELLELIPLYLFLPLHKREELMLHHYFKHDRIVRCDWVWGAYMFFPKSILHQLPEKKLSEEFFMYGEDVLWCWEIKQLGLQIVFLPEGKVMHVHKGSSPDKANKIRKTSNSNHLQFMKRIYPDWRWSIFRFIFAVKQSLIGFLISLRA